MPDSLPVIGPSPRDPRVVYAFGHGHVGLTLAGITGRIVADIVSGRQAPIDIAPLRPDRFGRA
jgi:D-amino-acid dehydrogenase